MLDESFFVNDKIPVRNVWFLFLYAHDLAEFHGRFDAEIENSPDFMSLVGRLLCYVVEKRLRRNLSFGYRSRNEDLTCVRGRINALRTESHKLLLQGKIACKFEELTINTPRNRLVRAALMKLCEILQGKQYRDLDGKQNRNLIEKSRSLSSRLERAGVNGQKPSRAEIATDQIARHESEDKLMVSLAQAVFNLILPTEHRGSRKLLHARREDKKFSKLFEAAIGSFYKAELSQDSAWEAFTQKQIYWKVGKRTQNLKSHLPLMQTDIVLKNRKQYRTIIIDTKFKDILGAPHLESERRKFHSTNIYQMYAYIRSQETSNDPCFQNSEGILLYPTIGENMDAAAEIDGHVFRFATIDLSMRTEDLIRELRALPFRKPDFVD